MLLVCSLAHAADEAKAPSPAKVSGGLKEAELAMVMLSPDAEKRLAITTAAVKRRKVDRHRTFGGEATVPALMKGGAGAEGGQSILAILPSLTATDLIRIAEAQVDADGQVEQAKVAVEAAKVALQRSEKLLQNKAGTERIVDETRVLVQQAEVTLRTAQARRNLLAAPVLDVLNPKLLWVRVPVYVGDLPRLATEAEVSIGSLSPLAGEARLLGKPVPAPPSANATAATVDLFYQVANDDGRLRLGQKLGVQIPLKLPEESLVVPWAAVVYDFQGGAWVYEQTAPQTYVARRVQVRSVLGEDAVLETGPKPGAKVAITGAAELLGTQFGVGK